MSELSSSFVPLVEDVVRPLPGENPCGSDITYDDQYLQIKAEIDRIEQTEYGMIVEVSRDLLVHKSKDLRVASYLAVALFYNRGITGMAEGLAAIELLVRSFWDGLYPTLERTAARGNALQFLTDRLSQRLGRQKVHSSDAGPLVECHTTIAKLQPLLLDKMGEQAPAMSALSDAVAEALRRAPKPVEPLEPADVETQEAPESTVSTRLQQLGRRVIRRDAWETVAQSRLSVQRAAGFMREKDRTNPVSHHLLRSLHWGGVVEVPPSENGKTGIPAPPAESRSSLDSLLQKGDWDKLLSSVEDLFATYPLWLDLQHMAAVAMEELGSDYAVSHQAVLWQTALLLARVPELSTLRFIDDTPLANAATLGWLEGIVVPLLGEASSAPIAKNDEFKRELDQAQELFRGGDLAGALEMLQGQLAQDNTGRKRFTRRLYMANLCMRGHQPAIARSLLETLSEEVDQFSLDKWDPDLTLEVWAQLRQCYNLLADSPLTLNGLALREKAELLFAAICHLDVRYAIAEYEQPASKASASKKSAPKKSAPKKSAPKKPAPKSRSPRKSRPRSSPGAGS